MTKVVNENVSQGCNKVRWCKVKINETSPFEVLLLIIKKLRLHNISIHRLNFYLINNNYMQICLFTY